MKTWEDVGISFRRNQSLKGESKERCPKCNDPYALSVNRIKETWFCHHCNWTGGLQGKLKDRIDYRRPAPVQEGTANLSLSALQWLASRGISADVAEKHKLHSRLSPFRGENGDIENCKYEAVVYPIYKYKQLVNYSTRRFWFSKPIDPKLAKKAKWFFSSNCEQPLLNTDNIDWHKPIFWVEGWLDGLSIETVGETNWLSLPNGSPKPDQNPEGRLAILDDFDINLSTCPAHVLLLDNDAPGQFMQHQLSKRLQQKKCLVVEWPTSNFGVPLEEKKMKDVGDILEKLGADTLKEFISNPIPYPLNGTASNIEVMNTMMNESPLTADAKVGIPEIDDLFSIQLGYLHIGTGVPGAGKSTILSDILRRISENYEWHHVIYSAEDSLKSITERIASQFQGKPFWQLDDAVKRFCAKWINEHFTFIKAEEVSTLPQILDIAADIVDQKKAKTVSVDPWNKIENGRAEMKMDPIEYLCYSINQFSRFVKEKNVAGFDIAHPPMLKTESGKVREVRSYYEINGGAQWGNIGDIIWAANPPASDRPLALGFMGSRFSVLKVRQKPELGRIGEANLYFDPKSKRFVGEKEYQELTFNHAMGTSRVEVETYSDEYPEEQGEV